jgi:hypothetical protein
MRNIMLDAQQAYSFLVQQATHIETQVYQTQYPDIQYARLVPVDTSANEWARTVTFFSQDKVGQAQWFHAASNDMPRADIMKSKFEHGIYMAGIGYGYDLEELGAAQLIPGTNLTADRGMAARRAYEEFMDRIVLHGDSEKNMEGLIDYAGITAVTASLSSGSKMDWRDKTADEILKDVNDLLMGIYTTSLQVEMADTIALPVEAFIILTTKRIPNTTMTAMEFLRQNNVYTLTTGRPLMFVTIRGLETAGASGTGRMVAYRRDPTVLKVHLPMAHRFLPVWQTGPLRFDIPGVFRTGGLEIRRPTAVRYMDGILTPGTN